MQSVVTKLSLSPALTGTILDIGCGGEGIIGRLYGDAVVGIDNWQQELDEAPDGFSKRLMDATALEFDDDTFDHITFFYSLMYMTSEEQQKAIAEAARVLKPDGEVHIWDCDIASAYPKPFCVDLTIQLSSEQISASYGIVKMDAQSKSSILQLCRAAGLALVFEHSEDTHFELHLKKEARHVSHQGNRVI